MSNLRFSPVLTSVFAICLVLTGCTQQSTAKDLHGTAWFADREWLSTVLPQDTIMVLPENSERLSPGTDITLQFGQATISGLDGCNHYLANYTIADKQLKVSDFKTLTELVCDQWVETRQEYFLKALLSANRVEMEDTNLALLDHQGLVLLIFFKIKGNLAGTVWLVKQLDDQPVLEDVYVSIDFGVDGRVRGSTGCNIFNWTYLEEGKSLHFGEGGLTERGCTGPEGIYEQESKMAGLLRKVAAFEVVGDVLLLKDIDGDVLLELLRR